MATSQSTIDYLLQQLGSSPLVRARKMFGEYALYYDEKVVALVCDDQLYLKPTDAGRKLLGHINEQPPYPGAKPYFLISEDVWEDRELVEELLTTTAASLPVPKPKRTQKHY